MRHYSAGSFLVSLVIGAQVGAQNSAASVDSCAGRVVHAGHIGRIENIGNASAIGGQAPPGNGERVADVQVGRISGRQADGLNGTGEKHWRHRDDGHVIVQIPSIPLRVFKGRRFRYSDGHLCAFRLVSSVIPSDDGNRLGLICAVSGRQNGLLSNDRAYSKFNN